MVYTPLSGYYTVVPILADNSWTDVIHHWPAQAPIAELTVGRQ